MTVPLDIKGCITSQFHIIILEVEDNNCKAPYNILVVLLQCFLPTILKYLVHVLSLFYLGQIVVSPGLDYETAQSYELNITVEDSSGLSSTGILSVNVINVQEPPVITNLPDTVSVSEGAVNKTVIFTVDSTDPEDDLVMYTMMQIPDTTEFYIHATSEL